MDDVSALVSGQAQRQEFGEYLRARRERIDPRERGLPVNGQRRTPGLRREEVAQLAGLSVDYYSRLEQARDLRPSAGVLESLARALQLGPAERDHLFRLGRAEPAPRRASRAEPVRPGIQRMLDALEPNPAFLTSRRMDVLAWNRSCAALVTDFGRLAPADRNLAALVFLDPRAQAIYGDWERVAADAVAFLRGASGRFPADLALTALIERLSAGSPEFRDLWPRHDVREKTSGSKEFCHPQLGSFTLDYETLLFGDTDQNLIVYTAPAGSAAQASIELLATVAPRS
jgi:transcriptional regulator with XRE-family HTH domain